MPRSDKPIPLTEDEAMTWLGFATVTESEIVPGPTGDVLIIHRDDGARLIARAEPDGKGGARLTFEAEGATA